MSRLAALPAAVSPRGVDPSDIPNDIRRTQRCWQTGAIYLLVGVTLLITLLRARDFVAGAVASLPGDILELRGPEDGVAVLAIPIALADSLAGAALLVFPIARRRLLIGILIPPTLFHLCGTALGLGCIVFDNWEAQWGGLTTMLGVAVALPCGLMLTLAWFARRRIVRGDGKT